MLARIVGCCAAAALLPLGASAQDDPGVIGSRLLNDVYVMGDGVLYIGFVNDTVTPLRVTLVDLPRSGQGFDWIEMPDVVPAHTAPVRVASDSEFAQRNPELHALGLDFAPFPQPGQAGLRYRRYLVDGRYDIWSLDPFAHATYRLAPEGPGAGPDSGVELALSTGSSGLGGFDYRGALIQLGAAAGGSFGLSSGILMRELAQIPGSWAYRWSLLDAALHDTGSSLFGMLSREAAALSPYVGLAMLVGEAAYFTGVSASGGAPMVASTHAFAKLGGPGVVALAGHQTLLEQVVRSRDGRYEYRLALIALPYVTKARAGMVSDISDALLLLGVRRVHSAEASCSTLTTEVIDGTRAMLRGRCRYPTSPSTSVERDTALDLELCQPGADIANLQGRLDCASRFSGPFEQVFRKYDGQLAGSYTYVRGELRVHAADPEAPVVLARLPDAQRCAPGSIRYGVVTRELKQFHSLDCDLR